ncbi:Acetyltransferase (GNAT) family protein [Tistlia consotensis]|uniref:Acetyltransferase (GNAT) domain-containing protein n=1 Tax=Tistlia consotensis USBA 355 TaxID=560819 RepID=A0A1Y6BW78_9PROT|nr:GNAT family N-acetyltransferase [Tistlia consotensis]SMF30904.1 Acetyltransferase (GNAT) domain-containing protein [Tistlia consotensis USBA 355]SNS19574.1 Acetyltransferase (GNAT) family protein [Tistlia consotensis]
MQSAPTITLDSYEITLSPMTLGDVPRLHELSIGVNWPHRPKDWMLLIELGEGFVARDEIGRILGSAMWFPMGERLASIGMVITSPRLQDQGAGRWLMDHILERVGARGKVLNATKAAYRLYLSMGFEPRQTVYQYNGVVTALPDGPAAARRLREEDAGTIVALDAAAYGASRSPVFERILPVSEGTVIERAGRVCAFALCREFGRGHVVGPVVAETEEDAITVIRPHVAAFKGRFLRMDTRAEDGPLRRFLEASGIPLYDTVTTMTRGEVPPPGPVTTYGLVNQALG